MEYKAGILPAAWEDLKQIEDYYLLEFGEDSALKVTSQILDAIELLEKFPDTSSRLPDDWLNDQGYKMIVSGGFVIIHKIIDFNIFIYHVANTQTEYTKLF